MEITFRPIDLWLGAKNQRPKRSLFKVGYSQTLKLLDRELDKLGAKNIVLQVYLPESLIRLDGRPRSGARPSEPGVIVSFDSRHGPLRYATDTYDYWQDNLRAIALGLESLRAVDRYGISRRGQQYTGWRQLPGLDVGEAVMSDDGAAKLLAESSGLKYTPQQILNDSESLKAAYRAAVKTHHPDNNGSAEQFKKIQKAKELLERRQA